MRKKKEEVDPLEIPTFLRRGHPDCLYNNPASIRSETRPDKGHNQETTKMAKKATKAAAEAPSYEGKSIAELVVIYNEKADEAGQPHRSTFKNAAAGIKAIEGLAVTAAAAGKKEKKAAPAGKKPSTPKADAEPRGEFGERPSTNKGKLIALLVKNAGKKVKITAAEQMLYGATGGGAINGVIFGATAAFAAHGGTLVKEGKGAEATLTFTRGKR